MKPGSLQGILNDRPYAHAKSVWPDPKNWSTFLRESIIGGCIGSLPSWWLVGGFSVRRRIRWAGWLVRSSRLVVSRGRGRCGAGWAFDA
jgi:hypothetical protein